MSKDTVTLIADIIQDTLRKGQSVPLHTLLGMIDVQLRLIPSLEEVNEALQKVPPIRVKRRGGRVELVSSVSKTKVGVTAKDIESAFATYHDRMSGWIDKLARKRSK
jgi:hypothetical protein